MVKFNVLMGKHLNVVGVLREDLSPVGAVRQNLGKGTINCKGRLDTQDAFFNTGFKVDCHASFFFHVVQIVKRVGFTTCPEGQAMTSMVLALE